MTVSAPFRGASVVPSLLVAVVLAAVGHAVGTAATSSQAAPSGAPPLAARIDPYSPKIRVVVLTDIANEPDDQMSMVRFLVYSNQFDVEGLVATTSTWMRNRVRPDVIRTLIDAYEQVQPNLLKHQSGFPSGRRALRSVVASGQPGYGMAAVGSGKTSEGARRSFARRTKPTADRCGLRSGAARTRSRRRCCSARHTHARASQRVRRETSRLLDFRSGRRGSVDSTRVSVAALHRDAVDAGRRSVLLRDVDRHQRRSVLPQRAGADFTTFTDDWVNANIRSKGPLGKLYPYPVLHPRGRHAVVPRADRQRPRQRDESDVRRLGRPLRLAAVLRREPAIWTQGGDSYPGKTTRATR